MKPNDFQETIKIGEWTLRNKPGSKWKASGPEGNLTLHDLGNGRWRLIYGRSSNRSQRRLTYDASGSEEALLKAVELLFGPASTKGMPVMMDIAEVFAEWWKDCGGEPYHLKTLWKHAGYFLKWCQKREIYYWDDLLVLVTPMDYVKHCLEQNNTRKTIQHYLEPVHGASRWAVKHTNGRYRDFFEGFHMGKKIGQPLKYASKKTKEYLTITQVVDLLEWMKDQPKSIDLLPTVALQGLCGLQLQEATRLTWDRVDLVNGTVTIEADYRHDPRTAGIKNSSRVRRLPVPSLVLKILQEACDHQRRPSGDQRIINVPSWKAYCSRLTHILKAWNPECHLPPSDLRNTLPTEFNNRGWMTVWFRRYFGHAPANQMERAYLADHNGIGVEEGTEEFVERLKVEVVDWVESLIQVRSDEIAPCISMIDIASETSIQGTL